VAVGVREVDAAPAEVMVDLARPRARGVGPDLEAALADAPEDRVELVVADEAAKPRLQLPSHLRVRLPPRCFADVGTVMARSHLSRLIILMWFLIVPPLGKDGRPDKSVSLSDWAKASDYFSADECKRGQTVMADAVASIPEVTADQRSKSQGQILSGLCIASDDPRLAK
jgi:hypothetical protein